MKDLNFEIYTDTGIDYEGKINIMQNDSNNTNFNITIMQPNDSEYNLDLNDYSIFATSLDRLTGSLVNINSTIIDASNGIIKLILDSSVTRRIGDKNISIGFMNTDINFTMSLPSFDISIISNPGSGVVENSIIDANPDRIDLIEDRITQNSFDILTINSLLNMDDKLVILNDLEKAFNDGNILLETLKNIINSTDSSFVSQSEFDLLSESLNNSYSTLSNSVIDLVARVFDLETENTNINSELALITDRLDVLETTT